RLRWTVRDGPGAGGGRGDQGAVGRRVRGGDRRGTGRSAGERLAARGVARGVPEPLRAPDRQPRAAPEGHVGPGGGDARGAQARGERIAEPVRGRSAAAGGGGGSRALVPVPAERVGR